MTVGEWLDMWTSDYLAKAAPRTADSYKTTVRQYIRPVFGAMKIADVRHMDCQRFISSLSQETAGHKALSPKTVDNISLVLHKCLEDAVLSEIISRNPADRCVRPKIIKPEICIFDDAAMAEFISMCETHDLGALYLTILFCGLREGEALGLDWDSIDFDAGTMTISHQLQRKRDGSGEYALFPTKNGKTRSFPLPGYVLDLLRREKEKQEEWKKAAGSAWDNPMNLVFTNEVGRYRPQQNVYSRFKTIARKLGYPEARVHDLRHMCATIALREGDDPVTVQHKLGHHSAAFTLERYGHTTMTMQRESADRLQGFIERVAQ